MTINWWALLLRGIAAIVFGIFAFVSPGVTVLSLVFVFGIYAIFDGIFAIVAGLRAPEGVSMWWMLLLVGLLGLIAGGVAIAMPGQTVIALVTLIGLWAIISGIFHIIAAIGLRKQITGEWMMILSGVLSVLAGGFLVANPVSGAAAVVWIIGFYAILYGIALTILGLRLRSAANRFAAAGAA